MVFFSWALDLRHLALLSALWLWGKGLYAEQTSENPKQGPNTVIKTLKSVFLSILFPTS